MVVLTGECRDWPRMSRRLPLIPALEGTPYDPYGECRWGNLRRESRQWHKRQPTGAPATTAYGAADSSHAPVESRSTDVIAKVLQRVDHIPPCRRWNVDALPPLRRPTRDTTTPEVPHRDRPPGDEIPPPIVTLADAHFLRDQQRSRASRRTSVPSGLTRSVNEKCGQWRASGLVVRESD